MPKEWESDSGDDRLQTQTRAQWAIAPEPMTAAQVQHTYGVTPADAVHRGIVTQDRSTGHYMPTTPEVKAAVLERAAVDRSGQTVMTGERVREVYGMSPKAALAQGLVYQEVQLSGYRAVPAEMRQVMQESKGQDHERGR